MVFDSRANPAAGRILPGVSIVHRAFGKSRTTQSVGIPTLPEVGACGALSLDPPWIRVASRWPVLEGTGLQDARWADRGGKAHFPARRGAEAKVTVDSELLAA